MPLLTPLSRGYSFSESLIFIISDLWVIISETIVVMLTIIVEVVSYCAEQYEQLLLKYLKTSQQMQSFFS